MDPLEAILNIINDDEKIPELGPNLSEGLIDFYHCCLVRDPSTRLGALELLEHSFLRFQVISLYCLIYFKKRLNFSK